MDNTKAIHHAIAIANGKDFHSPRTMNFSLAPKSLYSPKTSRGTDLCAEKLAKIDFVSRWCCDSFRIEFRGGSNLSLNYSLQKFANFPKQGTPVFSFLKKTPTSRP